MISFSKKSLLIIISTVSAVVFLVSIALGPSGQEQAMAVDPTSELARVSPFVHALEDCRDKMSRTRTIGFGSMRKLVRICEAVDQRDAGFVSANQPEPGYPFSSYQLSSEPHFVNYGITRVDDTLTILLDVAVLPPVVASERERNAIRDVMNNVCRPEIRAIVTRSTKGRLVDIELRFTLRDDRDFDPMIPLATSKITGDASEFRIAFWPEGAAMRPFVAEELVRFCRNTTDPRGCQARQRRRENLPFCQSVATLVGYSLGLPGNERLEAKCSHITNLPPLEFGQHRSTFMELAADLPSERFFSDAKFSTSDLREIFLPLRSKLCRDLTTAID